MPTTSSGMKQSAGGVIMAKDDPSKIYIRLPANDKMQWGSWTHAKGRVDPGETPEQTATREAKEELGVTADVVHGTNLGKHLGGSTETEYFLLQSKHDTGVHDHETEAVEILPWEDAMNKMALDTYGNNRNVARDVMVAADARLALDDLIKQGKVPPLSNCP